MVACLGDSNSLSGTSGSTWVDSVRDALPATAFRIDNYAEARATAIRVKNSPNAWYQLENALAQRAPDLVVLAFGTNDIAWIHRLYDAARCHEGIRAIVREYQSLASIVELAGAAAVVGLTPCLAPDVHQDRMELVMSLNASIRKVFPKELVLDFYTVSSQAGDLEDDLHLSQRGHARRAKLVCHWLSSLDLDPGGRPKLPASPRSPHIESPVDLVQCFFVRAYYWRWLRRLRRLARTARKTRTQRAR